MMLGNVSVGFRTRTVIDRMTFGEVPSVGAEDRSKSRALGGAATSDSLCRGGDAMQDPRGKNVTPLSQEVLNTPAPACRWLGLQKPQL